MDLIVILLSLGLLIFVAYKGFSVILFAPICALLAVFLTEPSNVLPFFSNVFMAKMVDFIKNYFPVFLLGAIFGKVIEMSGIADRIAKARYTYGWSKTCYSSRCYYVCYSYL